ncbi:hypothetical protein QQF64_010898 [Cirrhinus molitorella]|uniref:Secreted protein n=1 Tax=Cirrhinus molitorella TaxID=172907 RepID=A0ABR3M120_9TELE
MFKALLHVTPVLAAFEKRICGRRAERGVLYVLVLGCAFAHVRVYWPELMHERSAWEIASLRSTNAVRRRCHRTGKARIM